MPVVAISSVAGNTGERRAHINNTELARQLNFRGDVLRGADVCSFLRERRGATVLALGPLTNVAAAIRGGADIAHVIIVGGTLSTRGAWPPWWPHEFNLTRDRTAAREVFASGVRLTVFPLDVARRLAITTTDLSPLRGSVASFLRSRSLRWFVRLRLLKGTPRFPVYDLAAAHYLIDPTRFDVEETTAIMRRNTFLRFGEGTRSVRVCRAFDAEATWRDFEALMA